MPHLHLCNRAGFRDNAAKLGKPGHNRDIGPKTGTVPAKPGHLATMRKSSNYSAKEIILTFVWRLLFISVPFRVPRRAHKVTRDARYLKRALVSVPLGINWS